MGGGGGGGGHAGGGLAEDSPIFREIFGRFMDQINIIEMIKAEAQGLTNVDLSSMVKHPGEAHEDAAKRSRKQKKFQKKESRKHKKDGWKVSLRRVSHHQWDLAVRHGGVPSM